MPFNDIRTIPGMPAKIAARLVHVDSMSLTNRAKRALEIATNTPINNYFDKTASNQTMQCMDST